MSTVSVFGKHFVDDATGAAFFVKGIAYQPRGRFDGGSTDPISDGRMKVWQKDLELMKELGVNTLRVYQVDPTLPHGKFMDALKRNSMYLLLDMGNDQTSINRDFPSYDVVILQHYKKIVDEFQRFPSLLALTAGNEVINSVNTSSSAPYVKALIRDVKSYIATNGGRKIPVGYASSDDANIRDHLVKYFTCDDASANPDFIGLNLYEWCGQSTFTLSGFSNRTAELSDLSIPLLVSEYGCNMIRPRKFSEVAAIYGPQMTPVWSGGVLYEFTNEDNSYGIVNISHGTSVPTVEYTYFKNALQAVHPKLERADSVSSSPATSPAVDSAWLGSSTLPPTPDECHCADMLSGLECVADLNDDVTSERLSKLLSTVCGLLSSSSSQGDPCFDISSGDGMVGSYGNYSFCAPADRLSWTYNQYYIEQDRTSGACNFDGTARIVTPGGRGDCANVNFTSDGESTLGGGNGGRGGSGGGSRTGGVGGGSSLNDGIAHAETITHITAMNATMRRVTITDVDDGGPDGGLAANTSTMDVKGILKPRSSVGPDSSRKMVSIAVDDDATEMEDMFSIDPIPVNAPAPPPTASSATAPYPLHLINTHIPFKFNLTRMMSAKLLTELDTARRGQPNHWNQPYDALRTLHPREPFDIPSASKGIALGIPREVLPRSLTRRRPSRDAVREILVLMQLNHISTTERRAKDSEVVRIAESYSKRRVESTVTLPPVNDASAMTATAIPLPGRRASLAVSKYRATMESVGAREAAIEENDDGADGGEADVSQRPQPVTPEASAGTPFSNGSRKPSVIFTPMGKSRRMSRQMSVPGDAKPRMTRSTRESGDRQYELDDFVVMREISKSYCSRFYQATLKSVPAVRRRPYGLKHINERQKSFIENQARFYIAEITCGLDYLHGEKVIHRSIEPGNLLIDSAGHVKISDFSNCAALEDDNHFASDPCQSYGRYQAPEILLNEPHGRSSDWFSIGTILYEMLTGTVPFGGGNVLDAVAAVHGSRRKETEEGEDTGAAGANNATASNQAMGHDAKAKATEKVYRNLCDTYNISRPAEDLIRRLMEVDPHHRLTSLRGVMDVKAHPWLRPITLTWREIEEGKLIPPDPPGAEEDEVRLAALLTAQEAATGQQQAPGGAGGNTIHGMLSGDEDDHEDEVVIDVDPKMASVARDKAQAVYASW
ncbi:1,3-beta-glucanosyltransferase gas1 [Irineochytrium annulatum]|nr:1,3-beta-glucanosyltransferase gas1 [Irineochytrium annulatum]